MNYTELRMLILPRLNEAGQGATPEEIARAELQIGAFPTDYKEFLQDLGWANIGHYEVFGLGSSVPPYLDVIHMTILERTESGLPLPPTYICIMNSGGGDLYCFDSTQIGRDGISSIRLWDHEGEEDQVPEVIAPSFVEWLAELLAKNE